MAVVRESASRYVGRYEVHEYLGSGAMSDVYAALHTGLRKRVAIKVLRSSLRDDRDAVERFLREGECAARVSHPNVINVHDVGVEDGVPYLVMDFLRGETLDHKLAREGSLPIEMAVDLMLPIFDAVEHVHRAGVIHRDVKPSNILLVRRDDGTLMPKLVDFGVATFNDRRLITGNLGPIGTPTYMSPEQARGLDPVDPRSDQYTLASVMFELLCGREPFPGADIDSVLSAVARGRFPRLRDALPRVSRELDEVLARATAFHPRDRFASVHAFAEALLPFASRRMREAYQEGNLAEAEVSGARIAMPMPGTRDSEITVRVRASQARVDSQRVRQRSRRLALMLALLAGFALACGIVLGLTR
jgi:eukaryotic-like serine/threonine-protein kinase